MKKNTSVESPKKSKQIDSSVSLPLPHPSVQKKRPYWHWTILILFLGFIIPCLIKFLDYKNELDQSHAQMAQEIRNLEDTLQQDHQDLETIKLEIASLKTSQISAAPKISQKKILLVWLICQLQNFVNMGQPYSEILENLQKILPSSVALDGLIFFADSGIPSNSDLCKKIKPVSSQQSPPGHFFDRMISILGQLVRVKKIHGEQTDHNDELQTLLTENRLDEAFLVLDKQKEPQPEFRSLLEKKIEALNEIIQINKFIMGQLKD